MIELFTSGTANGQKVSIMLEECGLEYRTNIIDLTAGEHLTARFLAMNPADKIRSSSIPRDLMEKHSRSRRPSRSLFTWPKKRDACCRRTRAKERRPIATWR